MMKKHEFKSWAEFKDFASEHPKEFEKGDEIVVNQPIGKVKEIKELTALMNRKIDKCPN